MSRRAFTSNPLFDRKRRSVGYFGFNATPLLFLLLPACGLILVILSFIPGLVNIVVMVTTQLCFAVVFPAHKERVSGGLRAAPVLSEVEGSPPSNPPSLPFPGEWYCSGE